MADGSLVPALNVLATSVKITHFKLHLHGNWIVDIAKAFEIFFKSTVKVQIENSIHDAISTQLPAIVNGAIKSKGGYTEFGATGIDFNWTVPAAPVVSSQALEFAFKGEFFPDEDHQYTPSE